jgi:hypothetical protein
MVGNIRRQGRYSVKRRLADKLTEKQIGKIDMRTNYDEYTKQFKKNMRLSINELKRFS